MSTRPLRINEKALEELLKNIPDNEIDDVMKVINNFLKQKRKPIVKKKINNLIALKYAADNTIKHGKKIYKQRQIRRGGRRGGNRNTGKKKKVTKAQKLEHKVDHLLKVMFMNSPFGEKLGEKPEINVNIKQLDEKKKIETANKNIATENIERVNKNIATEKLISPMLQSPIDVTIRDISIDSDSTQYFDFEEDIDPSQGLVNNLIIPPFHNTGKESRDTNISFIPGSTRDTQIKPKPEFSQTKTKHINIEPIKKSSGQPPFDEKLTESYGKLSNEKEKNAFIQLYSDKFNNFKVKKSEAETGKNKGKMLVYHDPGVITKEFEEGEESKASGINGKHAISSIEVNEIMKNTSETYITTIPLDEIDIIISYITKHNPQTFSFIFNTKPASNFGKGSDIIGHFWAVYCDLNELTLEFYDPIGNPITEDIEEHILEPLQEYLENNTEHMLKLKHNFIQQEPAKSYLCAFYCIRFILMREQGLSFKKATGYSSLEKNEKDIKDLKNKWDNFGYI
jgi:hypothetical protein